MQIDHFIYDDPSNPWCGGGGAYRAFEINKRLAQTHEVKVYTGNFPNAQNERINGVEYCPSRVRMELLNKCFDLRHFGQYILPPFSVNAGG